MEVDFSEMFTVAARQAVQAFAMKAQAFSFDYVGPRPFVDADVNRLRRSLHRNLCVAADCLDSGFVMFGARADVSDRHCRVTVSSAGTGRLASHDKQMEVLRRSSLHALPSPADAPHGALRAEGLCPATGAGLDFSLLPDEGVLLRATFTFTEFQLPPAEEAAFFDRQLPRAWVVGPDDAATNSMLRRLQRLGWGTTRFDSCVEAFERIDETHRLDRLPALVMLFEFGGAEPADAERFREVLPPQANVVYTVVAGSPALSQPFRVRGCDLCIYPPSPAELQHYTREATGQSHPMSGETRPAPLSFADRPLVLVVDDNPLNRHVAQGLVESMGYEVITADHGLEAIEQCRRLSPRAVLMDVDMPVLDGIAATMELRRLQRMGAVPPCAIVAATAGTTPDYAERCIAAGMDGFLNKPLEPQRLREELRRVATL